MGCDIHFFVERLHGGYWKSVPITESGLYDPEYRTPEFSSFECDINQNYNLFGVLAGVRIMWINPIDEPRGLPKHLSPEVEKEVDIWKEDGHSFSWFSLEELLLFDWGKEAVVHYKQPDMSWIDEPDIIFSYQGYNFQAHRISDAEVDAHVQTRSIPQPYFFDFDEHTTPKVDEVETYADVCPYFVGTVIPKLKALGGPTEIRVVFWFDT